MLHGEFYKRNAWDAGAREVTPTFSVADCCFPGREHTQYVVGHQTKSAHARPPVATDSSLSLNLMAVNDARGPI